MVRKRLDDRIRTLLERSVATHQRSMLLLVGDRGKDQVPVLHQILMQLQLHSKNHQHSSHTKKVTWCYKRELGFSTHRTKRLKKLQREKARGLLNNNNDDSNKDAFELFLQQNDIEWCYYKDSHRVLGTTCQLLVLQDFEALTPNLMARTMETVAGGGLIVVLLRTVHSLKQLYCMAMDVHARYRTESAGDVVPRFNERFLLSLGRNNPNCLVCDDELNVLPFSRRALKGLSQKDSTNASTFIIHKGDAGEVIPTTSPDAEELQQLKESLIDTPHVGVLVELCVTLDQAKAVLHFLETCADATTGVTATSTVAMTAPRGRGKSAALGLCLAGAVSLGYNRIAVTAPAMENLVAVFDFFLRGLQALKFREHTDYTVQYNTQKAGREATKCVVAVRLHATSQQQAQHRNQMVYYIAPDAAPEQFAAAEIVALDEAAAIPLPTVRAILQASSSSSSKQLQSSNNSHHHGRRLAFLSSTVHGYEGTGRALSLKLLQELRQSSNNNSSDVHNAADASTSRNRHGSKRDAQVHEHRYQAAAVAAQDNSSRSSRLREFTLQTPIRYAPGDAVEAWLNQLLCLDSSASATTKLSGGAPAPSDCELYSVDRDALFSYHALSEAFLQKLMGLYTSAHYKNTPNDLQMLSDAPAHALFCLLGPQNTATASSTQLPDVLAVVQVALEGRVSRKTVQAQLARGHRAAGDLIPWTISQQFGDASFAQLSGARIVRVAVHPALQSMGYGSRAMELLYKFYNGEMVSLDNNDAESNSDEDEADNGQNAKGERNDENASDSDSDENSSDIAAADGIRGETLHPRKELPPLLLPLTEVDAPRLDWIGTSFGLTLSLHQFWARKCGMKLLYLRQTKNDLTGEHSAIMVRALPRRTGVEASWLPAFCLDTRRRLTILLGGSFREMDIRLALSMLENLSNSNDSSDKNSVDRSGSYAGPMTADELDLHFTPHDLQRLELYGRNLCDHHLVTDILPTLARLYFLGRFRDQVTLSNVQAALVCGMGLQIKTIDRLTDELGLPANQVLAMFHKAIRKISLVLQAILEARETKALLAGKDNDKDAGKKRSQAERAVAKMRDATRVTLEDDVNDMAQDSMGLLQQQNEEAVALSSLPPEIAEDRELMQYVVRGSQDQWEKALQDKNQLDDSDDDDQPGTVRIPSIREKRKAVDEDDVEREAANDINASRKGKLSGQPDGKKKKPKSSKKNRRK